MEKIIYLRIYFRVPNKRTVSNNRTGWDICQKSISEQDLISAQGISKTNKGYKVKKHCTGKIFSKINKRTGSNKPAQD